MLQSLPRALHFFFNENGTKNTGTGNQEGRRLLKNRFKKLRC